MSSRGFTLLEMLIALALVAVLLTAVGGLGTQILGHVQSTQGRVAHAAAVHSALEVLEQDLTYYQENFNAPGPLMIQFVSSQPQPWQEHATSGELRVTYQAVPSETAVVLYRTVQDHRVQSPPLTIPILTAQQVEFALLDNQLTPFPLWQQAKQGPAAVQVNITDQLSRSWVRTIPLWSREP